MKTFVLIFAAFSIFGAYTTDTQKSGSGTSFNFVG
jgi:hypothetical protein